MHKRLSATILVASLILVASTTACHQFSEPTSGNTQAVTTASQAPSQPYQDHVWKQATSNERFAIEAYLASPEREQRFRTLISFAGPTIAMGLKNGIFGSTAEYRITTEPFLPLPVGKVNIQTFAGNVLENNRTAAVVWWNMDGSIDSSMSFDRLSLTEKNEDPETEVLIIKPDKDNPYWSVFSTAGPNTVGNAFVKPHDKMIGRDVGHGGRTATVYALPSTLEEFKMLDSAAIKMFEKNMAEWFGDDWKQ